MAIQPRLPRTPVRILGGVVCLIALAVAAPAAAQAREATRASGTAAEAPAPPSATPASAPAAPRPIPAPDIPLESQRVDARLGEIGVRLRPDPAVVAIETDLPDEIEALRSLGETSGLDRISSLTLRHLEQIQQPWILHRTQMERWQSAIRQRTEEVEALRGEVRVMQESWAATSRQLAATDPESPLQAPVRATLDAIDSVQSRLSARLGELIAVHGRITGELIEIARAVEGIDAARAEARHRLFRIDRPPLWKEMPIPWREHPLIAQARESWVADWQIVRRFLGKHWQTAFLQGLIVLALVVLLAAMRRAGRPSPADSPDLQAARKILDRPYSASILVGLICTFFLYDEAPTRLHEVALLVALVPCLRLLPAIFGRAISRPIFVASAIFVLDRVTALLFGVPLAYRLLLMATTAIATLALAHVLRHGLPGMPVPGGLSRPLFIGMGRTAIACLAISGVANVWGNVTLAQILTDGTLRSAYLTLMLYSAAFMIDGLLVSLLRLPAVRALRMVESHFDLIRMRVRAVIQTGLLVLWVGLALDFFGLLTPVLTAVGGGLTHRWVVGTVSISIGDIAAFVVTLWLSNYLARFVSFILESELMPRLGVARGVPEAAALLSRNFILVLGFFLALAAAGIEIGRFAILMGALGVGVGFGLQNLVSNFISGLILAFERPIHVGDTIEVGPLLGQVTQIGFRSSTVRTQEGADVIVPNSNLISGELVNWTFSDQTRRVEIKVGVAYGSDPHRVLEILAQAARSRPDVLRSPVPLALFRGFGDSSLDFSLWFWTAEFQRWREVASQATLAVHDGLGAAGISIPFPQRDLHLRSVDPGAARSLRDGGA